MTYREFIQVLLDRANAEGVPASGSLAYLGFAPASYTIKVTGKPNWVWVRLAEEDERTPTQALNLAQVRLFPDLPVRVRKEGGVLAVVGYDPATIDVFLGNRPINITSPEANEPDLVGPRRIKPGLVHAYKANDTYSMTVQVEGFWYLDPATRKATYQPPGTLDLTSHIPAGANQHVYALVVFDRASKTLSAIAGTPKLVTLPLDDGDITGIAVGSAVPLCAVKLTTGMTALDKDYYFVDVRPWWTIAGEPLLVAGGAPLTINAGAVMASQTYHILAAETDTTDDLDTVVAAAANTFLLLQADVGYTITVKHGIGNIQLNGAADFVLSGDKTLLLFFDGTTWSDLGAGGGGGGALADHDHSGDAGDGGTFDAANLTSGVAADGQVLTADGAGGAAWEDPAGGGASALADLADVDTTSAPPTDGQALVWDDANSVWVPGDVAASGGGSGGTVYNTFKEIYHASKKTSYLVNPEPTENTLVDGMSVTFTLDEEATVVIWLDVITVKSTGYSRINIFDDTTQLNTQSWYTQPHGEGNRQSTQGITKAVLAAGEHTITMQHNASQSTTAVTFYDRSLIVGIVGDMGGGSIAALDVIDDSASTPPTHAELVAALGAADAAPGHVAILDVGGSNSNNYLVMSNGQSWHYIALTKAT